MLDSGRVRYCKLSPKEIGGWISRGGMEVGWNDNDFSRYEFPSNYSKIINGDLE